MLKTIIFIDIANYTEWCFDKTCDTIMSSVTKYFGTIDSLLSNVRKLETVGDCYVAYTDDADTAISFALNVLNTLNRLHYIFSSDVVQLRIGIHTGEVISMSNKWYGITMNIANRLQTSADINSIHISNETYKQVTDKSLFRKIQLLKFKGIQNKMITYTYNHSKTMCKKVLIIDDLMMTLYSLKTFLESKGIEVHTADNANDGLWRLKKEIYDFVLCDIYMPECSGNELVKNFRLWESQENQFQKQTIYAMSVDDFEYNDQFKKDGFDNFIHKKNSFIELHKVT